jgi:hypothetical protein
MLHTLLASSTITANTLRHIFSFRAQSRVVLAAPGVPPSMPWRARDVRFLLLPGGKASPRATFRGLRALARHCNLTMQAAQVPPYGIRCVCRTG